MKKYSEWMPADVLPVRDGVYEIEEDDSELRWYRLFYKGAWHQGSSIPSLAATHPRSKLQCPVDQRWRGLASDPEKQK